MDLKGALLDSERALSHSLPKVGAMVPLAPGSYVPDIISMNRMVS